MKITSWPATQSDKSLHNFIRVCKKIQYYVHAIVNVKLYGHLSISVNSFKNNNSTPLLIFHQHQQHCLEQVFRLCSRMEVSLLLRPAPWGLWESLVAPLLPVEEVRGQLSDPALGWVDLRRRFQQGGAQGCWRRVAYTGSTRTRFWFHTTGASGFGGGFVQWGKYPRLLAGYEKSNESNNQRSSDFHFLWKFSFCLFLFESSVLEKESSDLKMLAKLQ